MVRQTTKILRQMIFEVCSDHSGTLREQTIVWYEKKNDGYHYFHTRFNDPLYGNCFQTWRLRFDTPDFKSAKTYVIHCLKYDLWWVPINWSIPLHWNKFDGQASPNFVRKYQIIENVASSNFWKRLENQMPYWPSQFLYQADPFASEWVL